MILTDKIITATVFALLHSLWQALIIAMVLLIFNKAAKKAGSKLKYSVSFISLFAVLMSSVSTFYYYFKVLSVKLEPASFNIQTSPVVHSGESSSMLSILQAALENYSSLIFTFWFAGMTIFFIKFCIDLYYADSISRKDCVRLSDEITLPFMNIAEKLGIKKAVRFIESPLVKVPAVIGFFKPAVILPLGLISRIPSDQLEAVISHELAHIARNDFLHNLIQSLVEIVYFFNPSVIIISRMIRSERENCCDDLAVSQCRDSALLAKGLYNLELIYSNLPKPIMAAAGKRNNLLCRIKRLIGKENDMTKTYSGFIASLTVLTIITVITGCTLFASGSKEDEKIKKEEKTEKIIIIKKTSENGKEIKMDITADCDKDDLKALQLTMDTKENDLEKIEKQLESALKELEKMTGDQKLVVEEKVKAALENLKEKTKNIKSELKKIKIVRSGDDDIMIITGSDSLDNDIKECKEIKMIIKGDGESENKDLKWEKKFETNDLKDLWDNLVKDGLFKEKSDNLKLEINNDEIKINDVKIPDKLLEKYKKLLDIK